MKEVEFAFLSNKHLIDIMIILEIYIDWQEAFKTVHLLGNDYEIKLLYLYFYLKLNFLNWFF